MLLNFSAPQLAPNVVTAPQQYDINKILGLTPSQYQGFQSIANTPYFYGDGNVYETYTPGYSYFQGTGMGRQTWSPGDIRYGMSNVAPDVNNPLSGWQKQINEDPGTIYKGEQAFRPVTDANVPGFVKSDGKYSPSMAYVYANAPQAPVTQTPNVMSFLSAPTSNNYTGNYGAGRFLNTGGLLGGTLNFGLPSGQSANSSP